MADEAQKPEDDIKPDDAIVDTAPVTLSERGMAIARGEDPDAVTETSGRDSKDADNGGKDAAATAANDDKSGDKGDKAGKGWHTDDDVTLAKSYGWTPEDVTEFASREEFLRAGRLVDRSRKSQSQATEPSKQKPDTKPESKATAKSDADGGLIDLTKYKDFDPESRALAESLRKLQEERISESKQREAREARDSALAFHRAVDALPEELVGRVFDKSGRPTKIAEDADKARRELFSLASDIEMRIIKEAELRGETPDVPSVDVLVKRAANAIFADKISKAEQAKRTAAIREQSNKRRPVASRQAAPVTAVDEPDEAKRIARNPAIRRFMESR